MSIVETPFYLRHHIMYAPEQTLPLKFEIDNDMLMPAVRQRNKECWAIAALRMLQDRAVIKGMQSDRLMLMRASVVQEQSCRSLGHHYEELLGLPAGSVIARVAKTGEGILPMALDYLEQLGLAEIESSVLLTHKARTTRDNAVNIKRSVCMDGTVAITYQASPTDIHSSCIVGWDDNNDTWLLRDSRGATTIAQDTYVVAYAIMPAVVNYYSSTPFSGGTGYSALSPNRYSNSAKVGTCLVVSSLVLLTGLAVALLVWWMDKKF